ncbi:hypothetical protein ACHAXR_000968 [Thalassiosira sp. AJA248-18]
MATASLFCSSKNFRMMSFLVILARRNTLHSHADLSVGDFAVSRIMLEHFITTNSSVIWCSVLISNWSRQKRVPVFPPIPTPSPSHFH